MAYPVILKVSFSGNHVLLPHNCLYIESVDMCNMKDNVWISEGRSDNSKSYMESENCFFVKRVQGTRTLGKGYENSEICTFMGKNVNPEGDHCCVVNKASLFTGKTMLLRSVFMTNNFQLSVKERNVPFDMVYVCISKNMKKWRRFDTFFPEAWLKSCKANIRLLLPTLTYKENRGVRIIICDRVNEVTVNLEDVHTPIKGSLLESDNIIRVNIPIEYMVLYLEYLKTGEFTKNYIDCLFIFSRISEELNIPLDFSKVINDRWLCRLEMSEYRLDENQDIIKCMNKYYGYQNFSMEVISEAIIDKEIKCLRRLIPYAKEFNEPGMLDLLRSNGVKC